MLKNLFQKTSYEDYIPRPGHILYSLLFMVLGYVCMLDFETITIGVFVFGVGVIHGIAVSIGIAWRGPIAYWEQIEKTIWVMMKINSPEIWHAMGFKEIPQTVIIQEKRTDEHGQFQGMTVKKVPAIDPAMLNSIANTVLMSETLDFTEELYKTKVKNWRKTQKEFKENGWITPKNKRNVRGGYMFTRKGVQIMYEYADANIVRMIEKEKGE